MDIYSRLEDIDSLLWGPASAVAGATFVTNGLVGSRHTLARYADDAPRQRMVVTQSARASAISRAGSGLTARRSAEA
jgi:hypothetical protein